MIQTYGGEFLTLALVHFLAVIAPGPDFGSSSFRVELDLKNTMQ